MNTFGATSLPLINPTLLPHRAEQQQRIHLPHDVFQTTINTWHQPAAAIAVTLARVCMSCQSVFGIDNKWQPGVLAWPGLVWIFKRRITWRGLERRLFTETANNFSRIPNDSCGKSIKGVSLNSGTGPQRTEPSSVSALHYLADKSKQAIYI